MAQEKNRPIIIKRGRKTYPSPHGGAWKIAYADFVTAMMAFFLLLWMLATISPKDLEGIAGYFKTPIEKAFSFGKNKSGTSSVIPGGGENLARKEGDALKQDIEFKVRIPDKASEKQKLLDDSGLKDLKEKIEKALEEKPELKQYKNQIVLDITERGLRIQLVDNIKKPMFPLASADLESYTRNILRAVGSSLNGVGTRVSISGHTDALLYPSSRGAYSNWELSTDRANATRRELVQGGMESEKVLEVVGLGSATLFDKDNPQSPINRRIAITILNKKTQDLIEKTAPSNSKTAEGAIDNAKESSGSR